MKGQKKFIEKKLKMLMVTGQTMAICTQWTKISVSVENAIMNKNFRTMIDVFTYPFKMVWNSVFDNDSHEIVSKAGWKNIYENNGKD
jgi:endo-1,4-beta-mannosidase